MDQTQVLGVLYFASAMRIVLPLAVFFCIASFALGYWVGRDRK